jgi:hypothetical protein
MFVEAAGDAPRYRKTRARIRPYFSDPQSAWTPKAFAFDHERGDALFAVRNEMPSIDARCRTAAVLRPNSFAIFAAGVFALISRFNVFVSATVHDAR